MEPESPVPHVRLGPAAAASSLPPNEAYDLLPHCMREAPNLYLPVKFADLGDTAELMATRTGLAAGRMTRWMAVATAAGLGGITFGVSRASEGVGEARDLGRFNPYGNAFVHVRRVDDDSGIGGFFAFVGFSLRAVPNYRDAAAFVARQKDARWWRVVGINRLPATPQGTPTPGSGGARSLARCPGGHDDVRLRQA